MARLHKPNAAACCYAMTTAAAIWAVARLAGDLTAYLDANDLPRHATEEQGFLSIGCMPCTTPVKPGEDPRAGRWRGWDKVECGISMGNHAQLTRRRSPCSRAPCAPFLQLRLTGRPVLLLGQGDAADAKARQQGGRRAAGALRSCPRTARHFLRLAVLALPRDAARTAAAQAPGRGAFWSTLSTRATCATS